MAVQSRGAIIVLDDGGPDADDLVARVDEFWTEVYRLTDHDEPESAQHILNVGSKHLNTKTLVRQMYEEQAFFGVIPGGHDPATTVSDFLSSARGYLADGFPAFVLISGRPQTRYRHLAVVLDPTEPITTGSLTLAASGLAVGTGARIDALILGGDPANPPANFDEVREMFRIREGAEMLDQAEQIAVEHQVHPRWRTLGSSASRDQLVLDAVRQYGYDLVIDDLRPIDVGPRIGRRKRVHRQLVEGDSIDTAYRLLRDAPCDVAIVIDAVRMRLIPPAYAKGAAIAALSLGLLGVAARPATASAAEGPSQDTAIEAPVNPEAEATATAEAGPETDATADETTATATPAAIGTPAPSQESIPADVSSEQMASYEQSAAQEQATLQAEQATLTSLQQEQRAAESAAEMAQADLAIAQQDLMDAQATLDSANDRLEYAESARNSLSDEEAAQAKGSANRASYNADAALENVEPAKAASASAMAAAEAAGAATAEQQAVVDAQAANVNAWNEVTATADSRTAQRVSPVAGYSVTTSYGVAGSNWSSGYHTGSDFAAPSGTEVVAAASGTVTAAGFSGPYGNQITIQHQDGSETTYSHLSSMSVSVGDTVSTGAQIGAVGSTGNSTGPHLHFEAFDSSGERINPEEWLAGA